MRFLCAIASIPKSSSLNDETTLLNGKTTVMNGETTLLIYFCKQAI